MAVKRNGVAFWSVTRWPALNT